ncbi:aminotransferase class V-fold PLP-dependent enzyme [Nocardiopsis sp. NPDC057823]|uniref:aminotransferase class V-fold PLP-dependent enzyme n=1 Tax=Nocardiopsis sp. NPDC057823 TaxID=3346256 RepID=UPI00366EEB54
MDDSTRARIDAARRHFSPGTVYLNTATHGLTPDTALDAVTQYTRAVAEGRFSPADADPGVERARASYARLLGVPAENTAIGAYTAQFVGTVAAALPPGAEVVVAAREFSSVVHPFLARADLAVREVPLEHLADAVGPDTRLVAVSAVQSSDGRIAPLEDLLAASDAHGARLLVDATQAAGWLPLPADRIDYTVCSTYKWLLGPRGAAFLTGTAEALAELSPLAGNWYAAEEPWNSLYGGPLALAPGARRLDLPPVWPAWAGLERTLALLEEAGVGAVHAHNTALGDLLRTGLGLEPAGSAIVSVAAPAGGVERVLDEGIAVAARDGRLRASFHLYNTEEDVERLVKALTG